MVGAWRWLAYEIVRALWDCRSVGGGAGGVYRGARTGPIVRRYGGPQHQSFCKNTQNDNQDIRTKVFVKTPKMTIKTYAPKFL